MVVAKKQSRGRQRIEIKRIANEEARHVCFSKRRAGLFKKACELSILSRSEVSVVVFSPAGRAFSFGHPSVDSVADRLLAGSNSSGGQSGVVSTTPEGCNNVEALSRTWAELQALTEAAKEQSKNLKKELAAKQETEPFWWNADIWDMGSAELTEFERMLKGLKCKMAAQRRTEQLLAESYIKKPFLGVVGDSFGNVGGGGGGGVAYAANAPSAVKKDDDVQLAPLPPSLVGLDYGYSAIYDNLD